MRTINRYPLKYFAALRGHRSFVFFFLLHALSIHIVWSINIQLHVTFFFICLPNIWIALKLCCNIRLNFLFLVIYFSFCKYTWCCFCSLLLVSLLQIYCSFFIAWGFLLLQMHSHIHVVTDKRKLQKNSVKSDY